MGSQISESSETPADRNSEDDTCGAAGRCASTASQVLKSRILPRIDDLESLRCQSNIALQIKIPLFFV